MACRKILVSRHPPIKLEQKVAALYAANKIGHPLLGKMLFRLSLFCPTCDADTQNAPQHVTIGSVPLIQNRTVQDSDRGTGINFTLTYTANATVSRSSFLPHL